MLSSVGRAAPLHGVGREFEPLSIHQSFFLFVPPEGLGSFGGIFFGGEILIVITHEQASKDQFH